MRSAGPTLAPEESMGEQNIQALGEQQRKSFTRALLNEVRALEEMLERDMFEKGVRRIGGAGNVQDQGSMLHPHR